MDAEVIKSRTLIGDIRPQRLHIRPGKTLRAVDKGKARKNGKKRPARARGSRLAGIHLIIFPFPQVNLIF